MKVLVVKSEFGGHVRGGTITDPREVEAVLASENARNVTVAYHEEPQAGDAPSEPARKRSK